MIGHTHTIAQQQHLQRYYISYLDTIVKSARGLPKRANRAAREGHLDVLNWLATIHHTIPDILGMNYAASNGQLRVLIWAEQRLGILPSEEGILNAHLHKHFDIYNWLIKMGVNYPSHYLSRIL